MTGADKGGHMEKDKENEGVLKKGDLTSGPVMSSMLRFAVPMILGNLLQQCYNVADTLIVGQFLGANALAAVGSAYTLMTFITSIMLGLSMGSGALFSIRFGERDYDRMKESMTASFVLIAGICIVLNVLVFLLIDQILWFLRVPDEVWDLMREYLVVIFYGIIATFLYNYFASLLRAIGDSRTPLIFLAISAVLNIVLDLWFVVGLERGVAGAAEATVISQYVSGVGLMAFTWFRKKELRPEKRHLRVTRRCLSEISSFSLLTCVQQSVMNLGILMVQGLVNSFGTGVMAAFAAGVKIDSLAYMPLQEFGNAFSTFVSQNMGAGRMDRVRKGMARAFMIAAIFGLLVSMIVFIIPDFLMTIFVDPSERDIIAIGRSYLRIEGSFYALIGFLFLFYGIFRALKHPAVSLILTIISLGLRVVLAYAMAGPIGETGIWMSIPIGWAIADTAGILIFRMMQRR